MMGKGFLRNRIGVWLTLLASVAAVSGNLFAAEIRDVRISATETGTRVVLDLSAPVKHSAFVLDDPGRVVLDVSKTSLKSKLPGAEGAITSMRSGKLPHNGLRLVFEVPGPVTILTSVAAPAGDAGHRLILDIAGKSTGTAAPRVVAVTPVVPG